MSKFNTTASTIKTTNLCGNPAYAMDAKSKLVTQVLTSFFNESKFYGDNSKEIAETIKQVIKTDAHFVSQLAIFARREFNMRSISHVLVGYLANIPEGKPFVKATLKGIVLRGDDATEILSFYLNTFGKPLPNSLRRGLRDIFGTFDAYTLAKYKGESNSVKMRDVLCLTRPKPKDDQQSDLWKSLLEGTIAPAYTWESELSAKGNNAETWESLIDSGKVGYMALLRNLRNIIEAGPHNIMKVFDKIRDPQAVALSKQLPFRFLSAYKNLPRNSMYTGKAMDSLEDAVNASVDNLPKIPGKTVIAIDVSGSMSSTLSAKSEIKCAEIATMLGLIANKLCENAIVYTFDTSIRTYSFSTRNGILYTTVSNYSCGGGTDMYLPFNKMLSDRIDCDRVIIISDNECNVNYYGRKTVQSLADEYRAITGKNIWVHAIDLMGYGTQQFFGSHTNVVAGWSEKVFDFILIAEQGEGSLIKKIEEYKPYSKQ